LQSIRKKPNLCKRFYFNRLNFSFALIPDSEPLTEARGSVRNKMTLRLLKLAYVLACSVPVIAMEPCRPFTPQQRSEIETFVKQQPGGCADLLAI
jgi:hypothetical protein